MSIEHEARDLNISTIKKIINKTMMIQPSFLLFYCCKYFHNTNVLYGRLARTGVYTEGGNKDNFPSLLKN